ncbi:MAG: substrate-binding domain-containing protein [Verrucomicrobia bacterium]|nr:substrate-binding domain-containing protein [Verrucomicrobiota bacterium]
MNRARNLLILSALAVAILILLLRSKPNPPAAGPSRTPLVVYCAAGIKPPVEAVARAYEQAYGVSIQLQYGGSGTLLSNLRVAGRGDLFLAADESYLEIAQTNHLLEEIIPLSRLVPVIAVRKGNPKSIRTVADLLAVEVALANPEAAAVGRITRDLLRKTGEWDALEKRVRVFKPTVNDVANDIKLGTVDAGIIWDATARQYPELELVAVPALASGEQRVSIGVLKFTEQPTAALRFARYLGARDKGLKEFARFGHQPVEGDVWAETPSVVLFSGGVNRVAIEETLQRFENREGARVTRVYNGCGILVSQMKSGQRPDAYFACDTSFMREVTTLFSEPVNISRTTMVMLVPMANPKAIRTLADLAKPGLRLGLANEEQSALGALTARLLRAQGLYDRVMANVKVQTPTADLLVNQMRTGSLDAVVVYEANTSQVKGLFTIIPLTESGALATQPYAVGKNSEHRLLMERLLAALRSAESQQRFQSVGFQWSAEGHE